MAGRVRLVAAAVVGLLVGGAVVGFICVRDSPAGRVAALLSELSRQRSEVARYRAGAAVLATHAEDAAAAVAAAATAVAEAAPAVAASVAPLAEARLAVRELGLPAAGVLVAGASGWGVSEWTAAYQAVAAERDALARRVLALEGELTARRLESDTLRRQVAAVIEQHRWAAESVERLAGSGVRWGPAVVAGGVRPLGGGRWSPGVAVGIGIMWAF